MSEREASDAAPEVRERIARTTAALLARAHGLEEIEAVYSAYMEELRRSGVAVARSSLSVRLLHPLLRGLTFVWFDGKAEVERIRREHAVEKSSGYLTSPIHAIADLGFEGIRVRIERAEPPFEWPVVADLKAEGFTDYAAMPILWSGGRRNVVSFATRRPGGFDSDDLTTIYQTLPALSVLLEARTAAMIAQDLMDTYVGPATGKRILAGEVHRGSGITVPAVLWYCDLMGFTPLADRLPIQQLIALLNGYFEIMGGAVQSEGGEILKFIGDAILAIFPVDGSTDDACLKGLAAARVAMAGMDRLNAQRAAWGQPSLGCGIALHVGDVMYGNIGAPDRLDFTVIGPAVNLVSRLQGLTRRMGRTLLASSAFAASAAGNDLSSLGFQPVKGLKEPVEVFGLPEERVRLRAAG